MKIVIVSSSLNKASRSLILSEYAEQYLTKQNIECSIINLADYNVPFCGAPGASTHPDVLKIQNEIETAQAIITSGPIYNYGINAALKNILDITGSVWQDKPIAFMCVAGGQASYMAVMQFATNLMLNFRSIILPRFVYATSETVNIESRDIEDESIKERIEELCIKINKLAHVLD